MIPIPLPKTASNLGSTVQASPAGNQLAGLLSALQSTPVNNIAQNVQSSTPLSSDQISALLSSLQSTTSGNSPNPMSQLQGLLQSAGSDPTSQSAQIQALLQGLKSTLPASTLKQVESEAQKALPSQLQDPLASLQGSDNIFNLEKALPAQDFNPSMSLPLPTDTLPTSVVASHLAQITDLASNLPIAPASVMSKLPVQPEVAKAKLPLPLSNMMSASLPFTEPSSTMIPVADKALPFDNPILSSVEVPVKPDLPVSKAPLPISVVPSNVPMGDLAQLVSPLTSNIPIPTSIVSQAKGKIHVADQMANLPLSMATPTLNPINQITGTAQSLKDHLPIDKITSVQGSLATPSLVPRHHHHMEYNSDDYEILDLDLGLGI